MALLSGTSEVHLSQSFGTQPSKTPLLSEYKPSTLSISTGSELPNLNFAHINNNNKLGMFTGVIAPSLATILGIVIFLRLGYVIGMSGLLYTLFLLMCGFTVSFLTGMSIIAIVRNRNINGDNSLYAIICESMGERLSIVIFVLFYLAYVMSCSFHLMGFAESTLGFPGFSQKVNVVPWDRDRGWTLILIASIINFCILVIALLGINASSKFLVICMFPIFISLNLSAVSIMTPTNGTYTGPSAFSIETLKSNSFSDNHSNLLRLHNYILPGFIGFLAGTHFSGEIKTQRDSLPKGIVISMILTLVVYCIVAFALAGSSSGYILRHNLLIMEHVVADTTHNVAIGLLGICTTTISSAFSYFIGASRLLHAMTRDSKFLGKTEDLDFNDETLPTCFRRILGNKNRNPFRATIITWFLVQGLLFIGNVAEQAVIMTDTFLVLFCIINFYCLILTFNDSFEPEVWYRPAYSSLIGFILSFTAIGVCDLSPVKLFAFFMFLFLIYKLM